MMQFLNRAGLVVAVLFSCVGCDRLSKLVAARNLAESEEISLFGDFFRLMYAENEGAFLGFGAGASEDLRYWVLIIAVGLVLAGMLIFLMTSRNLSKAQVVALSLLLGGGIGNLVDRICNEGRVIDFMNLGIGSLRTGVFNVADIAISVGSVLLLIHSLKRPEGVP